MHMQWVTATTPSWSNLAQGSSGVSSIHWECLIYEVVHKYVYTNAYMYTLQVLLSNIFLLFTLLTIRPWKKLLVSQASAHGFWRTPFFFCINYAFCKFVRLIMLFTCIR